MGFYKMSRVIGHRGAKMEAPENTLASVRRAKELGCTWVEVDVMLTKDKVPVIHHDNTLERCTNGQGNLWDHTIEQIERLDAGSSFSTSDVGERIPRLMIAGEKVPRLTALLELCRKLSLGLNLEVKHVTEQSYMAPTAQEQQMEEELADVVCDTIEASKVQPNALIFSSFSRPAIAVLRRRLPHFCCGFLVEEIPDDWEAFMALHQCASLNFWWKHAGNTQARIQECTSKVPCYSYTVNDGYVAARLLSWGVSGVFSDCPDVVSMALDDAHVAS